MSAITTYATLLADIEAYAERHDKEFTRQIPRFIALAENALATKVRGLGTLKVVTGKLTQSTPVLAKPSRWRETVSVNITFGTRRRMLHLRTYEYLRSVCPDVAVEEAPRFYADYDEEHFLIGPTPNRNYQFELMYYEKPEPLSESNQTNWTTQKAPQLLLYGALLEAQTFLKQDQRTQLFAALYNQAVADVETASKRHIMDRSFIALLPQAPAAPQGQQ
jgi:hypothetical protein